PCPEDATCCVAQAGDSDHAARNDGGYFGQFLKNRRLLRDDRDTGAGIKKKKHPKRPPLPCPERFPEDIIVSSALRSLQRAWFPAFQLPALRRILHKHASNDCDDEVGNAEVSKCAQDTNALNESRRHWRGDERAGSESADRDASDESSFIGKP